MKQCKYAAKYKAIYPPRCNNGEPCQVCTDKWNNKKTEKTE